MSLMPIEPVGLPEGGPAEPDAVKVVLGIALDDDRDDDLIGQWVPAVNRITRRLPKAAESASGDDLAPSEEWAEDFAAGAVMLAARLVRRKASPSGVEAVSAAGTAVYVMRNDPDISMMLGIGAWARPAVG